MNAAMQEEFAASYFKLRDDFVKDALEGGVSPEALKWIEAMCDYNVLGGKMLRGLAVVETALILKSGEAATSEYLGPFVALGWCIELLQASFLVADDIMDSSLMRRGKPCWYKRPGVGVIAINDCMVLQSIMYRTLRTHFRGRDCYPDLLEIFHETQMRTELGQLMDLLTAPPAGTAPKLESFTMEAYKKIVHYKTAYYSFHLPVVAALLAGGRAESSRSPQLERILVMLGEYFQVQDDFLDCYGDPVVMGKIGTDIREGKCTWLIVMALGSPLLTPTQREMLAENYGKGGDAEAESLVKEIYANLQLRAGFEEYEGAMMHRITGLIHAFAEQDAGLAKVLEMFAARLFRRQK